MSRSSRITYLDFDEISVMTGYMFHVFLID